tara:strand:- start:244 stop:525 length:282 start_codon:yes stop_codon:yes gene_type:complete
MGVKKSKVRLKLESIDLILLLRSQTLKQIADAFGTNTTMIHKLVSIQLEGTLDNANKRIEKVVENYEDDINNLTLGAWSLSAERQSLRDFKTI